MARISAPSAISRTRTKQLLERYARGDRTARDLLALAYELGVKDASQALATQPATSQEGEAVCAQCKGMRDDLASGRDPEELCDPCYNDAIADLAATPTPPTLSEDSIAAFGAVMFGHIWESFTDDRWDIEINDLVTVDAVKAGLVSVAPYDPEVHNDQSGAAEVGDDFYEITPAGRAALAQVKAS